ncbi:unnamed protein product [Microthlaspi erraticum]|uniref:Uncharacterized protein n=1 Tax=Microthlaspi erraticum TaxID=1685480 RepID=A0A6D2LE51_9BRAS|nr:unnamed protein product [Microthlaspi erraticum]
MFSVEREISAEGKRLLPGSTGTVGPFRHLAERGLFFLFVRVRTTCHAIVSSGRARSILPGSTGEDGDRGILDPPSLFSLHNEYLEKVVEFLSTFSLNPSRFSSISSFGNRSFMLRPDLGFLSFLLGLASSSILDDPLGGFGVGALVLLLACGKLLGLRNGIFLDCLQFLLWGGFKVAFSSWTMSTKEFFVEHIGKNIPLFTLLKEIL